MDPAFVVETKLLELESNWMWAYQWPLTTLQFYEGDATEAATYLKQRFTEVVKLNPWLSGKLVQDKKKHGPGMLAMRYSTKESDRCIDKMFEIDDRLSINSDMPYGDLHKLLVKSNVSVGNGKTTMKNNTHYVKLTVIPEKDAKRFAVAFSMSHTVGDGHTYYSILDMLSHAVPMKAMDPVRTEPKKDSVRDLVGHPEYDFLMAPGCCMYVHYAGMMLKHKDVNPLCYYVDTDKIDEAKAKAKADGEVEYVSTNDVLTTTFAKSVEAKNLTMAVNWRGKLDDLTDNQAGNYVLGLLYGPDGTKDPTALRKNLQGGSPLSAVDLPVGCSVPKGNWSAMCTNWSSMSKNNLDIPGCTQTLHIPYLNVAEMMEDTCVIFKAQPGRVAVMLFVHHHTVEDVKREMPVAGAVNDKMFSA